MTRSVYDEDHEQFRRSVRAFWDKEHEPNLRFYEQNGGLDQTFWKKAAEAGFLGMAIPPEDGGAGADFTYTVIMAEEMGKTVGTATTGSSLMIDVATLILKNFGTDEQKKALYPKILTGEVIQCMPLTEPDAGSDPTAIKTTAIRDGDDYVINGEKYFISSGTTANILYIVCKTDPTKRGSGMSVIMAPADTPGVSRHKIPMMGWSWGDTAAFKFDNVRVPVSNLIGKEGGAMGILMHTFLDDRMQIAARSLGAAKKALELTLDYTKQRLVNGQRVFDFQNTQFVLAEVRTEIALLEALLDQSIAKFRKQELTFDEGAMLKYWATEMESRTMDRCLQLFGGAGLMDETPISRMYTAARIQRIYAGTSEVQKVSIARGLDR